MSSLLHCMSVLKAQPADADFCTVPQRQTPRATRKGVVQNPLQPSDDSDSKLLELTDGDSELLAVLAESLAPSSSKSPTCEAAAEGAAAAAGPPARTAPYGRVSIASAARSSHCTYQAPNGPNHLPDQVIEPALLGQHQAQEVLGGPGLGGGRLDGDALSAGRARVRRPGRVVGPLAASELQAAGNDLSVGLLGRFVSATQHDPGDLRFMRRAQLGQPRQPTIELARHLRYVSACMLQ